ncbi:MAG: cation:proton antiporter [Acidobacteriota bacterium]
MTATLLGPALAGIESLLAAAAPPFLFEAVCLLVAGAAIAYLCSRLGLVPIVGFLAAGVLLGPNALGLITNQSLIDQAAELGVMLLLFTIGIEFSLEKLSRIKGLIFGGGGLQVTLVTVITTGAMVATGASWQSGVFTGFLIALSSTAIVVKLLADEAATATPRGRLSVAFLIFQDLGIIAMVLLLPTLAGTGGDAADVAKALGSAGLLIAVVLLAARRIMPPLLEKVALACSQEVFLLTIIAICLGTAYLSSLAGVSVSLGAFLAGLVVSESRFSHHALTEILPLQILFSAVFFVSVGMLLDLSYLFANPMPVLLTLLAVLALKILTTTGAALALRQPLPAALGSGLMLAQVGEFSFVLERAGRDLGLTPFGMEAGGSQIFVAATVVLMVVTPLLAKLGARLDRVEGRQEALDPEELPPVDEEALAELRDHVIVAGYAASAQRLTKALASQEIPFLIVTLSPFGADEAEKLGMAVLRGDNGSAETLRHAGIGRARLMVVADDEPAKAEAVAAVARGLAPELKILVRTRSTRDAKTLAEAGADSVAADDLESTLRLCSEVMLTYGASEEAVVEHVASVRRLAERGRLDSAAAAGSLLQDAAPAVSFDPEAPVSLSGEGCEHTEGLEPVLPASAGCQDCLETGDRWVHLRVCLVCGYVGCCDSSPNRHATAHFHATGHAVMKSLEPGEDWGWCYLHEKKLGGPETEKEDPS